MGNELSSISQSIKPATAARYLPEPASTSSAWSFRSVMKTVRDVAADAVGGAVGGVSQGIGGDFGELINAQIAAQEEMQTTTMVSNVEKSKHESKMAAIRNIRVG